MVGPPSLTTHIHGVGAADDGPPDSPQGPPRHMMDGDGGGSGHGNDKDKDTGSGMTKPNATMAAPPLSTSPVPMPSTNWWTFFRTPRMNRLRMMTLTEPTSPVPFALYELASIAVLLITWCCDIAFVIRLYSDPSATKVRQRNAVADIMRSC